MAIVCAYGLKKGTLQRFVLGYRIGSCKITLKCFPKKQQKIVFRDINFCVTESTEFSENIFESVCVCGYGSGVLLSGICVVAYVYMQQILHMCTPLWYAVDK